MITSSCCIECRDFSVAPVDMKLMKGSLFLDNFNGKNKFFPIEVVKKRQPFSSFQAAALSEQRLFLNSISSNSFTIESLSVEMNNILVTSSSCSCSSSKWSPPPSMTTWASCPHSSNFSFTVVYASLMLKTDVVDSRRCHHRGPLTSLSMIPNALHPAMYCGTWRSEEMACKRRLRDQWVVVR